MKRLSYKRLKDALEIKNLKVTSYSDYMLHNIDCIKIGINNGKYIILFSKNDTSISFYAFSCITHIN